MNAAMAAASGMLFALGLTLSGMTSPARVIGFLDVFGAWDPQLVFVMGGAVASYALLYRVIRRRFAHPLLASTYSVAPAGRPDAPLLLGSALFGVGWGLVGLCPGPTLVALGAGRPQAIVFAVAMCAGMVIVNVARRRRAARADSDA